MNSNQNVIIVGGGLSGLTLAYFLSKNGIEAQILEASPRLGGRIQTIRGKNDTPMELGATWFSDLHPNLLMLIVELGLEKYPQFSEGISFFKTKSFEPAQEFYIPESESPSYRIKDGTRSLIDSLSQKLDSKNIHLNTKVIAIKNSEDGLVLETNDGSTWHADKAIVCLPPQLAIHSIQFTPDFGNEEKLIFSNVQTWMAGSIKFVLEYKKAFWRENKQSGMLFSHSGLVSEMYDHCNFEENKFGFTGFLSGTAASYPLEMRKELVLQQLHEFFGDQILNPLSYQDKIWTDELIVGNGEIIPRPHQNNGHQLLQKGYLDGKLYFSATETSSLFAGYMEGAIHAVKRVMKSIIDEI